MTHEGYLNLRNYRSISSNGQKPFAYPECEYTCL